MIDRCCPTLSRGLLKREFANTAAAFGVLVLLGFAVSMLRPALAQGVLDHFTAQLEQLGLTDDVPQAELLATLFFNNVTAALLSMLYGLIPFVPLSALAIGTNALLLGAFAALYLMQGYGLGVYLVGILPHGNRPSPPQKRGRPPLAAPSGLPARFSLCRRTAACPCRAHRGIHHPRTFEARDMTGNG